MPLQQEEKFSRWPAALSKRRLRARCLIFEFYSLAELQNLGSGSFDSAFKKLFNMVEYHGTPCNFQLALALITCLSKVPCWANLSGHSGHLNVLFASCTSLIWRFNEPLVEKSLSQMEHLCFTSKWTLSIWSSIVDFLANVLWHSGHWGLGIVKGRTQQKETEG